MYIFKWVFLQAKIYVVNIIVYVYISIKWETLKLNSNVIKSWKSFQIFTNLICKPNIKNIIKV